MAKVRIAIANPNDVPIPPVGQITIFADSTDGNTPKYKKPDGVIYDFGGGEGGITEWRSSVKSIETDPSTLTPATGDRFLIGDGATGIWNDKDGLLAVWGVADYNYVTPTNGFAVKVDTDANAIYMHEGEYVAGVYSWDRKPFASDVLGLPTDGSWADGLFNFEGYLVIDAFDEINEFLLGLAPPQPPPLEEYTETALSPKVTGKLSFDEANPIGTYFNADEAGVPNPISVDESFAASGKRLGITSATGGSSGLSGVLNDHVVESTQTPTPAYPAKSFKSGDKGTLRLVLNDVTVSSIDLESNPGAVDTTAGGTSSGLDISAEFPCLFSNGNPFEMFKYRTGEWLILKTDLRNGYNYIIVEHEVSVTEHIILDRWDFVVDDDTTATAFSNELLHTLNMTGLKHLSGIYYHTGGTALYDCDIDNAYRNTYSQSASAITHPCKDCSAPSQALADCLGDEALQVNIVDKVATITPSGIRLLDDFIRVGSSVDRTVQSDLSGGLSQIDNILLDNVPADSDATHEYFNDETYRMPSNSNFDNHPAFSTGLWDGEESINDGAAGYTDGLQVIDGKLIYPGNVGSLPSDFRTSVILNGHTGNDGGVKGTARDYSSLSGDRKWYRWWRQTSPFVGNFVLYIFGSGGTFVPLTTALTGDNIHVVMRAPTQTGWMDCYNDFATGQWGDGDGARNATGGVGRAFNTNWGLTIGTKSTANTGGYMVIGIFVGSGFTGEITGVNFTFG